MSSTSSNTADSFRVAIVGGGLVGSLAAVFLAKRGWRVDVYEGRADPRRDAAAARGRSINLALSTRGLAALEAAGVDAAIRAILLPMSGRLIHGTGGTLSSQPYSPFGLCIHSVDRKAMNEHLLTSAEAHEGVALHFGHRMLHMDVPAGRITFTVTGTDTGAEVERTVQADLIVGCDGAYSKVRQALGRVVRMNLSQQYIDHAYVELCIPATPQGEYAMDPHHLHIWPRQSFMMIALPNCDKSFTVTLFMPWAEFDKLHSPEDLLHFFDTTFSDAVPLMTRELLVAEYFRNEKGPLLTIKCEPYHYRGSLVILGDAAHAMVPFYGQGMNCGFEDCLVLEGVMTDVLGPADGSTTAAPSSDDMTQILERYTSRRGPDAKAICDLALGNYVEMRASVTQPAYLWRKWAEGWLHRFFPTIIIPLYTMVSFSRIPYAEVVRRYAVQTWWFEGLTRLLQLGKRLLVAGVAAVTLHRWSGRLGPLGGGWRWHHAVGCPYRP